MVVWWQVEMNDVALVWETRMLAAQQRTRRLQAAAREQSAQDPAKSVHGAASAASVRRYGYSR